MKDIEIFYLNGCPYCMKARKAIAELQAENAAYAGLGLKWIEENEDPETADSRDYYNVPSLFFGEEKLSGQYGLLLVFVGIEGRYALPCGAVLLVRKALLFKRVHISVPGQKKGCSVTYLKVVGGNGYALFGNLSDFF